MYHCSVGFQPPLSVSALLYGYARFPISVLFEENSTNGRHLLIGRILENNADEKGEPQYEEK